VRVLIVGVGSRGDVAPYVALGARLRAECHDVAIATHDTFAEMVAAAGLTLRTVSGDPRSLIRARMTPGISDLERRRVMDGYLTGVGDDLADAAQAGADVILTCLGQTPLCLLLALAAGVPSVGVYLVPAVPTAQFPMPGSSSAEHGDNRAAGTRLLRGARQVYADVLPVLARRLGLSDAAHEQVWGRWLGTGEWPVCLGYSRAVVPRPADWSGSVEVVGYWWPVTPPGWQPPRILSDFLAAGPPPVFFGFGSMAVGSGEQLGPVIRDAVRVAGGPRCRPGRLGAGGRRGRRCAHDR